MSTAELDEPHHEEEPLPEGVFHLLAADDDLACPYRGWVAVCGDQVSTSVLPPSCYPPGCASGRDPLYCPACVREAARWTAEGGQEEILRHVVQLADEMPKLTDADLRDACSRWPCGTR